MLNYNLQKLLEDRDHQVPNELMALCDALIEPYSRVQYNEIPGLSFMMDEVDQLIAASSGIPRQIPRLPSMPLELRDRDGFPAHWTWQDNWWWNQGDW